MRYLYGPVNSRRLGFSLGISLTCGKECNFDCVYCQLGRTREKINLRAEYVKIEEILAELRLWLQNNAPNIKKINYITLAGSGEPTLNTGIGKIIQEIKKITPVGVAVITNSSFLSDASVRYTLLAADLIVPSLDTVNPRVFDKINQPSEGINLEYIIQGLVDLRKEFKGKIWLEVMLVKGINDDLRHIRKLKEVIEKISPDKVQLNSPVRSSSETSVFAVNKNKLEKIKNILGGNCEII
ncbi:radical SAM protein [bacterium]|nr:MAG: radical SAM protein [bacterium]